MNLLVDAFWRAALYCLRPRVILLSLLPLALVIGVTVGAGYLFWDHAMDQVRLVLESSTFVNHGWAWLDTMGLGRIKTVLAPLIVIFTVTPVIVILCLLVVALLMTPVLVRLVAQRRFAGLEERNGASFLQSVLWSLGSVLMALLALLVSIPLWFVPPLVLVLPPLIWGWLTYRIMAFDALATHASRDEIHTIMKQYRPQLLGMGVLSGYLGAAPSLVWGSVAFFPPWFVFLAPMAIWIYTLVFAFSSLWFAHYCLALLHILRRPAGVDTPAPDMRARLLDAAPTAESPKLVQ
ncbi:EI24 domain-containing protein [Rhodoferax sp. AJA081-3]|uniref:EI24 domain-containing protein n=1 Tax=Rhodoferax sp. AJA081-3 TaxID=2752316 RepID=UPI001AE0DBF9|nr:EI24 domain-containing protein [Rhodoferax sp. AJA081-3]QTN28381.1 EI24 domain-containing protein [Rhodoferax sp. AJA081-3]